LGKKGTAAGDARTEAAGFSSGVGAMIRNLALGIVETLAVGLIVAFAASAVVSVVG
jgi:hypothetical protein